MAALHADVWHTWADPASFAHKNAVLDRHCAEVGRDPAEISGATGGTVDLRSARRDPPDGVGSAVQGVPDDVVAQLMEFRRSGADEFIVRDSAASVSVDGALALIDPLSDAVLPRLAS